MPPSKSIRGIAVSPGLAMGPVHVLRAAPDLVPTWSLRESEVPEEIGRLTRALAAVDRRLDLQRKAVASVASEKDAEILAVHRMILLDPGALERVERRIREERVNAEACVQGLIEHLEQTLGSLPGEKLHGYGADLSDPWRMVLGELMQSENDQLVSSGEQVVLAAAELTPYVVTFLDRSRVLAVITETGGRYSHGAVLARSFGFPCVVELPNLLSRLERGLRVIVDGDRGLVRLRPDGVDVDAFLEDRRRRKEHRELLLTHAALPARTPDGHAFQVQLNIESLRDLDMIEPAHTDGVGLLRTEFLYMERTQFPSEEDQYRLYRRALERMRGLEVTLRTLDIGGDKRLPYFEAPQEDNPALGWRGLRIMLERQDLLRVQLRAALRASAHGKLRLLLPMVSSLEELRQVRAILGRVHEQLIDQGYEVGEQVPLGVMVEVPATVFILGDLLREAEFASVGTNDLVQYLLAADRDNPLVSRLYDPDHPAVLRALARIAEVAAELGKPCTVCGEMAGDPATAVLLLGLGYTGISVASSFVAEVKHAVRHTRKVEAVHFARRALEARTAAETRTLISELRGRLDEQLPSEADARQERGDAASPAPSPRDPLGPLGRSES